MKSPEVVTLLRAGLGPWCRERGFRRTLGTRLASWTRPVADQHFTWWFSLGKWGFDAREGGELQLVFKVYALARALAWEGRMSHFQSFLVGDDWERLRQYTNRVIAKLSPPSPAELARVEMQWMREMIVRSFTPVERFVWPDECPAGTMPPLGLQPAENAPLRFFDTDDLAWIATFAVETILPRAERWADEGVPH